MGSRALPVYHVHTLCDLIHPDASHYSYYLKVPSILSLALFFLKSGTIYNCSDWAPPPGRPDSIMNQLV